MELGVLLPLSIQTRFKGSELWIRIAPDEPWFVRDDARPTPEEMSALRRYTDAEPDLTATEPPQAWLRLASELGPARAAYLHRTFIAAGDDGPTVIDVPITGLRSEPPVPRIVDFPAELQVWAYGAVGLTELLRLSVDVTRLLADFTDPHVPGDRRWWENWDEAVIVGLAGIVPIDALPAGTAALLVTGLGTADPSTLFALLADEGRLGLLYPGQPTNSVDGAAAASLATDPTTWWHHRSSTPPGPAAADVAVALTGRHYLLSAVPGGGNAHRDPATALVDALWPALGGFAAETLNDIAQEPIRDWVRAALYPEGPYPILRIGSQPYGILTSTSWEQWEPAPNDPAVEVGIINVARTIQRGYVRAARDRPTAVDADAPGLLDLLADTPWSSQYRLRKVFPLELWWLGAAVAGQPERYVDHTDRWRAANPLQAELGVNPSRQYSAGANSTRLALPLVVPNGAGAADVPGLLTALASAARRNPASFADTSAVEANVLGGRGASLLIRLLIRSIQLVVADLVRAGDGGRPSRPGALDFDAVLTSGADTTHFEDRLGRARPVAELALGDGSRRADRDSWGPVPDRAPITVTRPRVRDRRDTRSDDDRARDIALRDLGRVLDAISFLAGMASHDIADLERRLRATLDCAMHRVDPWLTGAAQRRLDTAHQADDVRRVLGAYGWLDAPRPGHPGPNSAGLTIAPSAEAAVTAAVLRDRAVSDPSPRWDLDITSRDARLAQRIASDVRCGEHLAEVVGRMLEHVVGDPSAVEAMRHDFPLRAEHAGRRVCDGLAVLTAPTFPGQLSADQASAVSDIRRALDTYADLLVADAVHHLVGGRADLAGGTMEAAAGLARPPELALLRTMRGGRSVSSSVVVAMPFVAPVALPAGPELALQSPATVLDPSVARLLATAHPPSAWEFHVHTAAGDVTLLLDALGLEPIDAMGLDLVVLERLAREQVGAAADEPVDGSYKQVYAAAAALVAVVGARPADPRSVSADRFVLMAGDPAPPELLSRYASARQVGEALVESLSQAIISPAPAVLAELLRACLRWGIVPAPHLAIEQAARQACDVLQSRLAAAPLPADLESASLASAATALVSSTGQVALTAALPPVASVTPAPRFDDDWLSAAAAVRPNLARLEVHQLAAASPFVPHVNRPADPWQTDTGDTRSLVAVYAAGGLDPRAPGSGIAASIVDRMDEVIPDAQHIAGAAFGFNAPGARAPQAVILAVPPVVDQSLDGTLLAQIVAETRDLAHGRMARPIDVGQSPNAMFGAATVPATGVTAISLEAT